MTTKSLLTQFPHPDNELLLAHILHSQREHIIMHPEKKIGIFAIIQYLFLRHKRNKNIPFAYITDHKEFFGLDFEVGRHTLVPRTDTEILVESVLHELQTRTTQTTLIDIGTGTGCIPISIFKNAPSKIQTIFAADISKKALRIAKKNAVTHHTPIQFFQGNLLSPILQTLPQNSILTANLPYLTQKQFDEEPSIQKEPHLALVANENGLQLYQTLLSQIKKQLPSPFILFFEIDPSQTKPLSKFVLSLFENAKIDILKDYAHNERVLKITLPL